MKKIIFCIASFLLIVDLNAQVNISPLYLYDRVEPFKPEMIEQFKKNTMAFFYRKADEGKLDKFKKAFEQVWNLTKVEFVPLEKFNEYMKKPGYSYFAPTVFTASESSLYYVYGLWLNDADKNKRYKIASIPLKPTKESFDEISSIKGNRLNESVQAELLPYYEKATYVNLLPGYFKIYLAQMSEYLKKGEVKNTYEETPPDEEQVKSLKNKLLYVPKYIFNLTDYGSYYAELYDVEPSDSKIEKQEKKLFEKYPGKEKVVSREELSDLIINANEDVYFLHINLRYNSSPLIKSYIGVINCRTGKVIYSNMLNMLKLKEKNFEDLIKKINGDFSK